MTSFSSNTDQYPETLILEPGQTVIGRFLRLESAHTRTGEPRAIAIVSIEGDERAIWLHEWALRAQFRDLRPEPGETVSITKGKAKKASASGTTEYWPFAVSAPERAAEVLDWTSPLLGDGSGAADGVSEPVESADLLR